MSSTSIYTTPNELSLLIEKTISSFSREFRPTYLYIKQHSVTGLKYFGKTCKEDPYSYLGSGTHWERHYKKHGKEYIETDWCKLFTSLEECVTYALTFSIENDIVKSDEWANKIPENGINGGDNFLSYTSEAKEKTILKNSKPFSFVKGDKVISGTNLNKFCKLHNLNQAGMNGVLLGKLYICSGYTSPYHIEYWKSETPKRKIDGIKKQSEKLKGKTKSTDHIESMKSRPQDTIQITCPYCEKVGDYKNMHRWHLDNCKKNPNRTDNIKIVTCSVCGYIQKPSPNFYRYHEKHCNSSPITQ